MFAMYPNNCILSLHASLCFFQEVMTAVSPTLDSVSIVMIFTPMLKSIEVRLPKNVLPLGSQFCRYRKLDPAISSNILICSIQAQSI
ncbi:hypothetical protein RSOLAG1IB_09476 [Rhizoctonia solani AG-1 IB]|uniref:Uncharacterized protein n=1 Tax=Thanatephorus cucumeris (strain AG1-IB / isolate 7/3/14) TaxID=1108050 RepID=A0A0B7FVP7_THACB|nr:hypothetical protein RSOLAG1IB_09476 [Rhizoctonia solani AG-1 IB]